jgi:hypothetical protein
MKNGPGRLKYFENNWPTNKGAWFPGEAVRYREKSLFDDFSDSGWMTLFLYGINGKFPTENQAKMIEKIWLISSSFPDPRLWNNRISSLAATSRSTGSLAISASVAVTEAKIYGTRPVLLGSSFLVELEKIASNDEDIERYIISRLKKERNLPGFGRPIISKDERIGPLLKEANNLGFGDGRFINLVFQIKEILAMHRYKLKPNIAIFCSALFLDLGFSPRQCYLLAVLAFCAGMVPCYIDAMEKSEGCFFPLACKNIEYDGHKKRGLRS